MLRMIKRLINILIFPLFITAFFFVSCKRETYTPVDIGYKYFPVNIGHWVTYEVDSTVWDGFYPVGNPQHIRKYHFQITELIQSTFLDNQNRPTQRIERYEKNDTLPTFLKNVWVANLTSVTAEKVEGNVRYIKLVFPIDAGQAWNGNAFNTLIPMNYQYDNVFEPYTVNGVTFDSTVTVIQDIDSNLINVKNMFEVYAKNVGMIFKQFDTLLYQPQQPTNPYPDSIVAGVKCTYKIISYGN
jgi:hypothetical protein